MGYTMKKLFRRIYGKKLGDLAFEKTKTLIDNFPKKSEKYQEIFSQQDVVLITYGDTLQSSKILSPLQTLYNFANKYFKDIFSTIHLLPFFPFSSDDGFSVKDFYAVNPDVGSWEDIDKLGADFKLMFDFVLNHISAQSDWFKHYLADEKGFENLAIEVDSTIDLSKVTRPRSLPLLTEFKKKSGKTVNVWTTFSADQVDINYTSVEIMIKLLDVLLYYVKYGATILRLDAIAYLWKKIGTDCIHLPETHDVVKVFRKVLDEVAPHVIILTETNVPHQENISYFGNGKDEAQMVYNFSLPPLLFYSFVKEDSTVFSNWAKTLTLESDTNTFFNFTASHDGIGVRPLEGILSQNEIDELISVVNTNGGAVSYKRNPDGSDSPYELNITYVDAYLRKKSDNDIMHAKRFLASQTIQLVLPGVPAVYIHSILGSHNWIEGVKETQRARTINRQQLDIDDIALQLKNPKSFRSIIFFNYIELIKIRRKQPAFHPNAEFQIMEIDPHVFAIVRSCNEQKILAVTNISSEPVYVSIPIENVSSTAYDLISGKSLSMDSLKLQPYESVWLVI